MIAEANGEFLTKNKLIGVQVIVEPQQFCFFPRDLFHKILHSAIRPRLANLEEQEDSQWAVLVAGT